MKIVKPYKSDTQPTVVSPGIHEAVLTKVNSFENHWGERFGFEFTLKATWETILRTTTSKLTPRSKLAELLQEMTKEPMTAITEIDLDDLVGRECEILVKNTKGKNGLTYSNVEHVLKCQIPEGNEPSFLR